MEKVAAQHGDVVIFIVNENNNRKWKPAPEVLRYGETTGHSHKWVNPSAVLVAEDNENLIQVLEPVELTHEEHETITLQPGIYRIDTEREYDYEEKIERLVCD